MLRWEFPWDGGGYRGGCVQRWLLLPQYFIKSGDPQMDFLAVQVSTWAVLLTICQNSPRFLCNMLFQWADEFLGLWGERMWMFQKPSHCTLFSSRTGSYFIQLLSKEWTLSCSLTAASLANCTVRSGLHLLGRAACINSGSNTVCLQGLLQGMRK